MTIATAIATKQQQIADSYTAVSNKGGTLPQTQNLTNLATAISSIPSGGGSITLYAWHQYDGRVPMFFYSKNPSVSIGDSIICDFDDYASDPLPIGTVTNVRGEEAVIQVTIYGPTTITRDDYYRAPEYDRTL